MRVVATFAILIAYAASEEASPVNCGTPENPQTCSTDNHPHTTESSEVQHPSDPKVEAPVELPNNSTSITEQEEEYCKPVKTAWKRKLDNILGKLGFSRRERVWVCTKSDGSIRLVYSDPKAETPSSTPVRDSSEVTTEAKGEDKGEDKLD